MSIHENPYEDLRQALKRVKHETAAKTGFRETGIAWLGNEEGIVIIPPNERRHPAEAYYAYSDINGTRQVIRLANYDAALTYSNKDKHRAVRIGIPPSQELLGVLGVATEDAKVFGPASPAQLEAKKQAFLTPDRWQMLRLTPAGGRRVNVEAGWYYDNGLIRYVPAAELLDLDGYYPTNPGETRIVMLGWTEAGTTRLLQGDVFTRVTGDPLYNHFPTAPFEEGDLPLGGAILTYGETELIQARLLPYLPFFEAVRTNILAGVDVTTFNGFLFYSSIAGELINIQSSTSNSDPGVGDDENDGWGYFSMVLNTTTSALRVCLDPAAGAADWRRIDRVYSTANVGNPPTDAELDAVFGTPAANGTGFLAILDDNGAGTNVWLVAGNGTNWYYTAMTQAV